MNLLKLTALACAMALAACADKPMAESAPVAESVTAPAMAATPMDSSKVSASGFESRLQDVLKMPHRSEANRARDKYRHPLETLTFFGLKDTDTVIEITPGAGWYAEILAPLLKGSGSYIAALPDPAKASSERAKEYFGGQNKVLEAAFKANESVMGAPTMALMDGKAPVIGAKGSADMVLTFRNIHNWVGQGTDKAMFKAFFDVLKTGGRLGLTEHRAAPGTDAKVSAESGYMTEAAVMKLALDAGFKLVASSEINANPLDTKDYEGGVWTLPPTLGLGEKDKAKYLAIGESDRMTMVFVKP
jgi:predicted methyltransferase